MQKKTSFAREIKYRLKLVKWAIIMGQMKLHGLSADWGSMFDDSRHPIVALLAWQQCDTELNLGIDTCCKFIWFFF